MIQKLTLALTIMLNLSIFSPAAFADNAAANESLINASLDGQPTVAASAIQQGANLELRHTPRELTPLMLAIYRDHEAMVAFLLTQGANVNARNGRGHTPLMMVASGGQLKLAQLLVKQGAIVDAQEEFGNTALLWASYWGHTELVRFLLSQQASAQQINQEGNSVLHLAAQGGLAPQARDLIAKPKISKSGRQYKVRVSRQEQTDLFELLIQHGAELNQANHQGQTALMLLAQQGAREPIQALLKAQAALDLKDHQGQQASDYAKAAGYSALARRLLPLTNSIERID